MRTRVKQGPCWRWYLHAYVGYQNEIMRCRRIAWGVERASDILPGGDECVFRQRVAFMSEDGPIYWNVMIGDGLVCA